MRVEFYAANLHQGGAVPSAALFFDQIESLWGSEATNWIQGLHIVVSPRVAKEMDSLARLGRTEGLSVEVRNDTPRVVVPRLRQATLDLRYSVRGPEYRGRQARIEVAGFADGSILPARPDIDIGVGYSSGAMGLGGRLKRRYKLALLKSYDGFIVQTNDMARSLATVVRSKPIRVVPSTVSRAFRAPAAQVAFPLPERRPGEVRLFYPARGYPHKNHRFIPRVAREYERLYGTPLAVVVTLRDDEMESALGSDTTGVMNVGEVDALQCPDLYRQTDGLFFPTLNETFSASPIEASFMCRPVIAPRLPFMLAMTEGHATYFESGDPSDAAMAVYLATRRDEAAEARIKSAREWAERFPDPNQQARDYLSILRSTVAVRAKPQLPRMP